MKTNLKYIFRDQDIMTTQYKTKTVFQPIGRNVRSNGSANIEYSNDPIPYGKKNNTNQFKSELLLLPKNNSSPYCHTYSKANAVVFFFKKLMNKIIWIKKRRWGSLFFFFITQNLYVTFLFLLSLFLQIDSCDKANACLVVLNTMTWILEEL